MAVDGGYGPKGYPKFDPNGAPEPWVDLEAVGEYAARVGNRIIGTKAEREALSTSTSAPNQRWLGLTYYETDTGLEWTLLAAGWAVTGGKVPLARALQAAPQTIDGNLQTINYSSLDFESHAGIVDGVGGFIAKAPGRYELKCSLRYNNPTGMEMFILVQTSRIQSPSIRSASRDGAGMVASTFLELSEGQYAKWYVRRNSGTATADTFTLGSWAEFRHVGAL
jgi:hypothetical protein